jgi:hypothetical protein
MVFLLVSFEIGYCFMPRLAWTSNFLLVLLHIAEMTGPYLLSLVEMESCKLFFAQPGLVL